MKNPFTHIKNKFTQTFDNVRQTIFRQRKKDEGTKKETARGKGGGAGTSMNVITPDLAPSANVPIVAQQTVLRRTHIKSVIKRRIRNKMASKSRRINRLYNQYH